MKKATLAIIIRDEKLLLGRKQGDPEIGAGTLNGPGGKLEPNESLLDCLVREIREEVAIEIDRTSAKKVAIVTFFVTSVPDFEVHVYRADRFSGEPRETEAMIPEWHALDHIPYDRMLEADSHFFPRLLAGETFNANVYYREKAKGFEGIEFFPFLDHD